MNAIRILVAMVVVALINTGCLSYMATEAHNNRVTTNRALSVSKLSGGEPAIGVNILSLTPGYFAAWSDSPGTMAAATAGDLVTTAAAVYAGYKAFHSGDNNSGAGGSAPSVNGSGNATYVNSGSGNQTIQIDQHSGQ